jgi:signal transduction histidine kinase
MAVPLALVKELSPLRFLEFCAVGLEITTVMGLGLFSVLALINPWLKKQTKKIQELISVLLIGLSGAFRGVLVFQAINALHYKEPSSFLLRIGTSTTTTLFWLTTISVMATSRKRFQDDYQALLRKAIVTLSYQGGPKDLRLISEKIDGEFHEIEEVLQLAFKDNAIPHSKESLLYGAASLKKVIEEKIRPLSHRLWIESASSLPKVNLGNSLLTSIKHLDLPAGPLAIFLALTSTINVTSTLGWRRGIFATVIILIEVYPLVSFYQKTLRPKLSRGYLVNSLLLLVPGLVLSGTFYLSNKYLFHNDVQALNLIYILIFLMAALLVSTFQLVNKDRAELLLEIEGLLIKSGSELEFRNRVANENVASYLHNSLQSELLSIARQMESSAERLDAQEFHNSLDLLMKRLNQPLKEDFDNFLSNPLDRLNKLPGAWRGIADINISIPHEVLQDRKRNLLLVQCVEEAIANAVRHSKASAVFVEAILLDDQRVRLSISNNGLAPKEESVGMGTAWLDHHAPNSWKRRISDEGTELVVTL